MAAAQAAWLVVAAARPEGYRAGRHLGRSLEEGDLAAGKSIAAERGAWIVFEGDGCLVGLGGLLVAGRDAAPLLEAVEAAFVDVVPLVELLVEGWRTPAAAAAAEPVADLVGPLGNGV